MNDTLGKLQDDELDDDETAAYPRSPDEIVGIYRTAGIDVPRDCYSIMVDDKANPTRITFACRRLVERRLSANSRVLVVEAERAHMTGHRLKDKEKRK